MCVCVNPSGASLKAVCADPRSEVSGLQADGRDFDGHSVSRVLGGLMRPCGGRLSRPGGTARKNGTRGTRRAPLCLALT